MSCPDCISGSFLSGEPAGTLDIDGAYHTPAPATASEAQKKRAVILLTDALSPPFGLPLVNCKLIADQLAERLTCDVWFFWALITRIPYIIKSRRSVVDARFSTFFIALQEQKKYEKIGAVGYCFGGATAVRLGATDFIQSAVVCHPAPFSTAQFKAIKAPTSWVFAEDDLYFKPEKRLEVEAVFAERKDKDTFVDYECRDYKGTTHGFASRPDLKYPEIKEAFEKALEQTVGWFNKTLLVG
ncbi:Alpha/Beta hydrolase protein [Mycena galericulata]|nr:Alpha/Beta hydrolase protein [Mycena galericulata]